MHLAAELRLPLVTLIDTPGAALSREAEEGGLAGEIARCLHDLVMLKAPTLAVLLGQGTGGGALALAPADRVLAAANGWLGPLPPEGASAIVHRDVDHAGEMAQAPGRAGHRPVAGRDRRPRRARAARRRRRADRVLPAPRPGARRGAGRAARAGTTPSASAAACTATGTWVAESGRGAQSSESCGTRRLWSGSSRSTIASQRLAEGRGLLLGERVEHRLADGVDVARRHRPDDVPAGVGEDGERCRGRPRPSARGAPSRGPRAGRRCATAGSATGWPGAPGRSSGGCGSGDSDSIARTT